MDRSFGKAMRVRAWTLGLCLGIACELLWSATIRVNPTRLQVHTQLTRFAGALGSGDWATARSQLQSATTLVKKNAALFDSQQVASLDRLVAQTRLKDDFQISKTWPSGLGMDDRRALNQFDPLAKLHQSTRHKVDAAAFAEHSKPRIVSLHPAVNKFSQDFQNGAAAPQRAFDLERDRTISGGSNRQLLDAWQNVDSHKRIFVTGANSDTESVSLIRRRYEGLGYAVFFYRDCLPQCLETTVGAFFGTAGTVINIMSEDAARSPFVPVETALIQAMVKQPDDVLTMTGQDASSVVLRSGDQLHQASGMVCNLSQLQVEVPRCVGG